MPWMMQPPMGFAQPQPIPPVKVEPVQAIHPVKAEPKPVQAIVAEPKHKRMPVKKEVTVEPVLKCNPKLMPVKLEPPPLA